MYIEMLIVFPSSIHLWHCYLCEHIYVAHPLLNFLCTPEWLT